VKVYNAVN